MSKLFLYEMNEIIVRKNSVKAIEELSMKRKNTARTKLKIAMAKNHFLPATNSSLANHEIKYPTGIPRIKIIISSNILFLSIFII